ncbi:MAG TPA: alanyl-tRNA editing protein [Roseiflexaceae bacterium]|nr:alanyl-tRNA editing protein [Roseiflexaceae bacterium]
MKTERLYYADSYLRRFNAQVLARRTQPQPAVALDRSAFYPEGGGQPADHGTLNGIAVHDTQAEGDLVWHVMAQPLDADTVEGEIDWQRRFDHMQQHHGQHLLSAAFANHFGLHTESFHLGVREATIDLATATMSGAIATEAEALANRVIWEARPVQARFVDAAELASLQLRKPPSVRGPIRVVSVPEFDHSACGGTHPATTGGVGLIFIRRWERRGESIRITFVCGERATTELRRTATMLGRIAGGLSVATDELEAAISRIQTAEEQARSRAAELTERLLGYEVQELATTAQGDMRLVRAAYDDRSLDEARSMARQLTAAGCVALIGIRSNKAHVLLARPANSELDCGALLREVLAPFGGRGGGRPDMAQGGLNHPHQLDAVLDAVTARIKG